MLINEEDILPIPPFFSRKSLTGNMSVEKNMAKVKGISIDAAKYNPAITRKINNNIELALFNPFTLKSKY